MATQGIEFNYAARSDIGLKRTSNQDAAYAGPNLLVLADGMGGAAGGDIASSVAVSHLAPLDFESHNAENLILLLRQAFQDAHDELIDRAELNPDLVGLGTTCIAVLRSGNKLAMAHIGDSRAYVLRDNTLTQVTTDHSFVQFLISQGEITPEEAHDHPQRNAVTKVLGYEEDQVEPDETIREGVVGDRWLLCSDGLSGLVSDATLQEVLSTVPDPGECAEDLISLALRAGGTDNITCIVCDIVPVGTSEMRAPDVVGAAAQERFSPSRLGSSAAAKAAQLVSSEGGASPSPKPAALPPELRPSIHWRSTVLALILTTVVACSAWLGYVWSQTQFYLTGASGSVIVYQGIPQSIGSWQLSTPIEVTDIQVSALPEAERLRLQEPVLRSSREEINSYLEQLRESAKKQLRLSGADSKQSGDRPQSADGAQSTGGDLGSQSGSRP